MDGEKILKQCNELPMDITYKNQFPVIDLKQDLVLAQWIESFLKELDQDLEKGGNNSE